MYKEEKSMIKIIEQRNLINYRTYNYSRKIVINFYVGTKKIIDYLLNILLCKNKMLKMLKIIFKNVDFETCVFLFLFQISPLFFSLLDLFSCSVLSLWILVYHSCLALMKMLFSNHSLWRATLPYPAHRTNQMMHPTFQ